MKRSADMTKDTINRRSCSLRTHRYALIRSSKRQRPGVEIKHFAYRLNAGMGEAEFGLTEPMRPNCQIVPAPSPTYKSP
jgi:hypothetical protein